MSEENPSPTETPKPAPPAQEAPKVEETDWKAEARKWEERAKENKTAAERLAEIEEANKTAEQKAAERLAAAEKAALNAEAKVTRRDVALEFKLSKDDAAMLDSITDEDAMRALAARLSTAEEDSKKRGNVAPSEGRTAAASGSPANDFAGFLTSQLHK